MDPIADSHDGGRHGVARKNRIDCYICSYKINLYGVEQLGA